MSKSILIVEDDVMIREAFTIVLTVSGYKVTGAVNGIEALKLCKFHDYDLILLDYMMPELDGLGFLKQAHMRENAPKTRIIMLSNLSSNEITEEVMNLGAHRYEVKASLAPKQIVALVESEIGPPGKR
jgi:DNA-binding response OmpR family regulator